jgi:Tol biopolymer transport system component
VTRFTIAPPPAAGLTIEGTGRDLAISPDGSRVVYVGDSGRALIVQALDELAPTIIRGLGAPSNPVFSPDGKWIAFFDGATALEKVPITGGQAVTLVQLKGPPNGGAFWATDGTLIFMNGDRGLGLLRMRSTGGEPDILTRPDLSRHEVSHYFPHALPDARAMLFTIFSSGSVQGEIAVADLRTAVRKVLARGSQAAYVAPGYLVYAIGGTLWAAAFDLRNRSIIGSPVPVLQGVMTIGGGLGADFSVSATGTLVYVPQEAQPARRVMVWVDRRGGEQALNASPRPYIYPRLSPDEMRIAVAVADDQNDIWMSDTSGSRLTRFTSDPGFDLYPVWTPDGTRLIWGAVAGPDQRPGVYWQARDGTGVAERLTNGPDAQYVSYPVAVSPDGASLIVREDRPDTGLDLALVDLHAGRQVTSLVRTPASERNAEISPDGRWLAYESTESGREEIYVRPFPRVSEGRWQISVDGGRQPLWARTGRELFYRAPDGSMMSVRVDVQERSQRDSAFSWATPIALFKDNSYFFYSAGLLGRTYDVSADGQRFLMVKERGSADDVAAPKIVVVQNWQEELKRLVPAP